MEDRGWRMVENPSTAIVSGSDEDSRPGRLGGGEHGAGDFFGRAKGDGANGGTGAAEEGAERAGGFSGGDHVIQERDQFLSKRLMEMIGESAAKRLIFPGSESGGDGAGVSGLLHGVETFDSRRQKGAGFRSRDFEIGNEKDEVQLGGNSKHLAVEAADDVKAAGAGRGGVVGMAFEFGAKLK